MNGYNIIIVGIISVCNSLSHLNSASINSEAQAIPLQYNISRRSCPGLKCKRQNGIGAPCVPKAIDCWSIAS